MALNIKNPEVEELARRIARRTGETMTEAIRKALEEREARLRRAGGRSTDRTARLLRVLEADVWPNVPPDQLGRRWTKEEEEAALGYGPEGV